MAINDYGELFAWGNNKNHRLGFSKIKESSQFEDGFIPHSKKYDLFYNKSQKVIEISCGRDHVAAVISTINDASDSGSLYTWGLKQYGRLGNTPEKDLKSKTPLKHPYGRPHVVNIEDKVARVSCGDDFTACLTVRGKLYTWGFNKNGFLGTEIVSYDKEEIPIIATPTIVASLSTKIIVQVSCGSKHMICLTNEREVFSWGSGEYGVLGHGNTSGINKPQVIKALNKLDIIFVAAGAFDSGAITGDGKLYLWGRGKYGILGFGNEDDVLVPKQVTSYIEEEMIFYVSLGFYHTIALSINLKAFAWGYAEAGRLGCVPKEECESKKHIIYPKEITSLRGLTVGQVIAGDFHTIILEANIGKLIGWGQNIDFVLGMIKDSDNSVSGNVLYLPKELTVNKTLQKITGNVQNLYEAYFSNISLLNNLILSDNRKIKKLACGGSHTLCLTKNGTVYSWGFGPVGQLGIGNVKKSLKSMKLVGNFIFKLGQNDTEQDKLVNLSKDPIQVEFPEKDITITKIYAGLNNSMAISSNHLVYIWGDNTYGQLCCKNSSNDGQKFSPVPLAIEEFYGKEVVKGALGYDNCALITSDRKLYVWGANENLKLGVGSRNLFESSARMVDTISNISSISLGLHHSAAINEKNELFTWGHGFYGQLGQGLRSTQGTPKKVDKLSVKYIKVKCGSYQTLAIDKKRNIYIFGKGGLNLNMGDDHKLVPESVSEFKSSVMKTIQVANGTSFALNNESELYSWGDNQMYKVSVLEDKIITNHSMQIKFNFATKCNIVKVFSGFYHAFILNELGEVYGWGNSDCYRLTSKYGEVQQKTPVLINIFENMHKMVLEDFEDDNINVKGKDGKKKGGQQNQDKKNLKIIDERHLRARLKMKNVPLSFGEICLLYENIDKKFTDNSLIENDAEMLVKISNTFSSIASLLNSNLGSKKFVYIDRLLNYRFKELKIEPKSKNNSMTNIKDNNLQQIYDTFLTYMYEIEAIYTLIYIHPCCLCDYFEDKEKGLKLKDFPNFINGLYPLFTEIYAPFQRNLSYDSVIILIIFKILLQKETEMFQQNQGDLYNLNDKKGGYIEHILNFLCYNRYKVSVLFDALNDPFRMMIKEIGVLIQEKKNSVNLKKLLDKYNNIETFMTLDKEIGVELLFVFFDSMIKLLEQNLGLFTPLIEICMTKAKRKFKKSFRKNKKKTNDDYNNKEQVITILTRLFFKNVIAVQLGNLFKTQIGQSNMQILINEFVMNTKKNRSSSEPKIEINEEDLTNIKQLFYNFIDLLCKLFQSVSCNVELTENIDEETIDLKHEENIRFVRKNTLNYHKKLRNFVYYNLVKSKFEYKKELISSIISSTLSTKSKQIHIPIGKLVQFLFTFSKLLNVRQNNRTLTIHHYQILARSKKILESFPKLLLNSKNTISITINTNFLYNSPQMYLDFYSKELQLSKYSDWKSLTKLKRCKKCHLIMPGFFILNPDNRLNELMLTFKEKVKNEYNVTRF